MMYETRWAGFMLVAMAVIGCADAPRPTIAVADSGGIRIVTNLPGSIQEAEARSLSAEPVVELGAGASPDVPLYEITAVVPLGGGRVAVGTNTPPRALVFGPDGTLAATLGREGEGPGEFAGVASVVPMGGGSLAVWDPNRRRISIFTEGGSYVRGMDLSALALQTPLVAGGVRTPTAWTELLPSGAGSLVLFQEGIWGDSRTGVIRMEVPSYLITAEGDQQSIFGPFPGKELFDFGADRGGVYWYPFGASTYGVTSGDAFAVGTAEAPEFRIYGPSGTLERIVRWPDHDRTVGGPLLAEWTETKAAWFESMSPGQRRIIGDILDRMPQAERFPAYDGIIAGDGGEIWVGEYAGQLEIPYPPLAVRVPARRWLVFDGDGALTATVRTPEGFKPYGVRDGRVWGIFTDALDVESVRAYGIVKG